ncbi:uncharacterized protein [Coffea arabica]|uniref:Transposase MuDR plant domain-containing protein n=1 Tax=Coffea arabica TaxID=13443 RepID=A0ABM4UEQ0_COFAR
MEKFKIDTRFDLGIKFGSRVQFKAIVQEYGIKMERPVYTKRNESKRVRAKCKAPCQWFVFVSIEKALGMNDLVVKSMHDKHENCNHVWKNKNLKAKWLFDRYMERIRPNSQILVRESRQTVNEEYQAQIFRWIAAKVRKLALEMINGSAEHQYKRIWEYCAKIKKTHEGSTMEVMFTPFRGLGGNPKFMRIYCCLGSMKKGFKDDCRPVIGLDRYHLKWTYRGQLLTAIATDPNNGWWPIA